MKVALSSLALAALVLAGSACDQPGTTVRVDIDAPGLVLSSLGLDASLATGPHTHKDLPGKVPVEVLLLLPDVATTVTVAVAGIDAGGTPYSVTKTIGSVPHQQVELSIVLGNNVPGADGGDLGVGGDMPAGDLAPTVLSVLAGQFGGDGDAYGTGANARFFEPNGLALSGNTLFVVEGQSGALRKLDITTNTVTSVPLTDVLTGTPFTFSFAYGAVYDGAGGLYVSSVYDHTIRKVVTATGMVSLVAGLPSGMGSSDGVGAAAGFWGPSGLALDGLGNLWVADSDNGTVRKIVLSSGTVSTPAGVAGALGFVDGAGNTASAGPARFTSPNGLVFYAGNLYVTDGSNDQVSNNDNRALRKLVVGSSPVVVSTIVGTAGMTPMDHEGPLATAGFGNPVGVVVDAAGNFYVADESDNHVRKVVTGGGGMVSVLAGSAGGSTGWMDSAIGLQAQFYDPRFLAIDPAGQNLWLSDQSVVRQISLAGSNAVTTSAGMQASADEIAGVGAQALLDGPSGVVFDGNDTLYVADRYGQTVRQVTLSTGNAQILAGGGPGESKDGVGAAASFGYPTHLAVDAAHNTLYVADSDTRVLRKVVMAGATATVSTVAGNAAMPAGHVDGPGTTMALFDELYGVAFDGAHTVYLSESGSNHNYLRAFNTVSGMVSTVAGSGVFDNQNGVGGAASFRSPRGLAYDPTRNILYVSELWGQVVRQVQLPGANVTYLVGQVTVIGHTDGKAIDATFHYPNGLALDPTGRWLYIADEGNDLVRRLDLQAGMVDTLAGEWNQEASTPGPLPARVHSPFGVAWTPRGLVIATPPENVLLLAH